MTAIDLSSDVGLVALYLLTANLLLGLLMSARYNPWTRWPHRRISLLKLHNWTGYTALAVAIAHPLVLLASSTAGFHFVDVIYPVHSPKQPLVSSLGALALYTLIVIVSTSYFRVEIGRRVWKKIHYAAYAAAILFYVHGILTDQYLKGDPIDYLDGEKVGIEICVLVVAAATALRVGWALKHPRFGASARSRARSVATGE